MESGMTSTTLTLEKPAESLEHKFAVTIARIIDAFYGRTLGKFDEQFSFEFQFSSRRTVAVLVTECDEHRSPCYEALVHVFDPSYSSNYSENCWEGVGPVTIDSFHAAEFVSKLGLASLDGGLASIELKIHFQHGHSPRVAHLIMKMAGLVDMYTR